MSGLTDHPSGDDPAVHGHADAISAQVTAATSDSESNSYTSADSWRFEVAARLERYRTRRKPRTPRYPSLLLPFDSPESWSRPAPLSGSAVVTTATARVKQDFEPDSNEQLTEVGALAEPHPVAPPSHEQASYPYPEQSAKVIEFPRSAAIPVFHASELADPIFDPDRPRIVEAPEILPPPPALGGMLMEPLQSESAERRADSSFATPTASIGRRGLAAAVDGIVLAASIAGFAAVVLRLNLGLNSIESLSLNSIRGALPLVVGGLGAVAVILWAIYEFLFVVYTGSTPGLRVTRLQLAGFDGSPLPRRTRRWRVLASFLSAFSAGLGYLWCVLDQDGLCWHDRITHTHVTPAAKAE